MTRALRLFLSSAVAGMIALTAMTGAQEDDAYTLPPRMAQQAEALILARCALCHTPDLIYQQRLSEQRWAATVEKMVRWGADLSTDEAAVLIRYLAVRYRPGAPEQVLPLHSQRGEWEPVKPEPGSDGPIPGLAAHGSGKYSHHCQACHGEGAAGGVGPKLARSGILKNEGAFWETVLYGRGSMPAWAGVLSDQDIADIHAWLKTLSEERNAE
jgi:cytochrome c oxidase cbb3-type subunit 3